MTATDRGRGDEAMAAFVGLPSPSTSSEGAAAAPVIAPAAPSVPYSGREHPVPCLYSSPREAMHGKHVTFADDRICDRCRSAASSPPTAGREPGGGASYRTVAPPPTTANH